MILEKFHDIDKKNGKVKHSLGKCFMSCRALWNLFVILHTPAVRFVLPSFDPNAKGRDPFNQNLRAEVRKFIGGKWIATGPKGPVPFHSQKEFRAHLKGGCWIAVSRVRVTWQIRLYQWYYASCFMCRNLTRIINLHYFEQMQIFAG